MGWFGVGQSREGGCSAGNGGGCEPGEMFIAPADSGVHVRRLPGWRFVPGVAGAGRGRQGLGADGCGWPVRRGGLEAGGWRCWAGRCGGARLWVPVEEGWKGAGGMGAARHGRWRADWCLPGEERVS